MERVFVKLEFFTSEGSTCHSALKEWRPGMTERLTSTDSIKYKLNSFRGKAYHWEYAVLFFDVKEEDVDKELINSNYQKVKVLP